MKIRIELCGPDGDVEVVVDGTEDQFMFLERIEAAFQLLPLPESEWPPSIVVTRVVNWVPDLKARSERFSEWK